MNVVLNIIKKLRNVNDAIKLLKSQIDFSDNIQKALDFANRGT